MAKNIVNKFGWCRCCLSRSIELAVNVGPGDSTEIYEEFLGVKIIELKRCVNGFCQSCYHRLKMASDLKRRCLDNEKSLKDLFQSGLIQDKLEPVASKAAISLSRSTVVLVDIKPDEAACDRARPEFCAVWSTEDPLCAGQEALIIPKTEICGDDYDDNASINNVAIETDPTVQASGTTIKVEIDESSPTLDDASGDVALANGFSQFAHVFKRGASSESGSDTGWSPESTAAKRVKRAPRVGRRNVNGNERIADANAGAPWFVHIDPDLVSLRSGIRDPGSDYEETRTSTEDVKRPPRVALGKKNVGGRTVDIDLPCPLVDDISADVAYLNSFLQIARSDSDDGGDSDDGVAKRSESGSDYGRDLEQAAAAARARWQSRKKGKRGKRKGENSTQVDVGAAATQTETPDDETFSTAFDPKIVKIVRRSELEVIRDLDRTRMSAEFRDKPYKCMGCVTAFSSQLQYDDHKEKLHSEESGDFGCHICSSHFAERPAYQRHLARHYQQYVCVACGKALSDMHVAKVHYERYHDSAREQFCKLCLREFKNKRILMEHMKLHDADKCYACVHCPRVYSARCLLVDHLSSHTGVKLHRCPYCKRSFSRRSAMINHSILHDERERRRYRCDECGLSYATRGKLNEHFKIGARHLQPDRLKYSCDKCDSRFVCPSELKTHRLQKHTEKPDKKFLCDLCGTAFAGLRALNNHREKHHKLGGIIIKAKEPALRRFKCKGCRMIFYSADELDTHAKGCQTLPTLTKLDKQNAARAPQKVWVCSVCQKVLTTKAALRLHMNCHSGDRPFACAECGCRFTQPGNLKRHIDVRHAGHALSDRLLQVERALAAS